MAVRRELHVAHQKTGPRGPGGQFRRVKASKSKTLDPSNRQAHKLLQVNSSQTAFDKVIFCQGCTVLITCYFKQPYNDPLWLPS